MDVETPQDITWHSITLDWLQGRLTWETYRAYEMILEERERQAREAAKQAA